MLSAIYQGRGISLKKTADDGTVSFIVRVYTTRLIENRLTKVTSVTTGDAYISLIEANLKLKGWVDYAPAPLENVEVFDLSATAGQYAGHKRGLIFGMFVVPDYPDLLPRELTTPIAAALPPLPMITGVNGIYFPPSSRVVEETEISSDESATQSPFQIQ